MLMKAMLLVKLLISVFVSYAATMHGCLPPLPKCVMIGWSLRFEVEKSLNVNFLLLIWLLLTRERTDQVNQIALKTTNNNTPHFMYSSLTSQWHKVLMWKLCLLTSRKRHHAIGLV
eukprot:TRINITY_DN9575_c0_g1_i1.p1 TRINITY_DN9575_c0_g1~~TRINITY_DN9575_c0_g1_i1.p1  ORF type:complete len:116 (+),score=11.22 TRINITY_DN9575_c0_g1_i1:71-418(+)